MRSAPKSIIKKVVGKNMIIERKGLKLYAWD